MGAEPTSSTNKRKIITMKKLLSELNVIELFILSALIAIIIVASVTIVVGLIALGFSIH